MFYIQFMRVKIKYFTCFVIKIKYIVIVICVIDVKSVISRFQKSLSPTPVLIGACFTYCVHERYPLGRKKIGPPLLCSLGQFQNYEILYL